MYLPQPPTDNLYKFLAIGGLLIIVLPLYYIINREAVLNEKIRSTLHGVKIDSIEWEFMEKDAEKMYYSIDTTKLKDSPTYAIDMRRTVDSLESKSRTRERATVKLAADTDFIISSRKELDKLEQIGLTIMIFGLLLSGAGFTLWYFRVQKYVDRALKEEAVSRKT